ncbi:MULTISPECIES: hypothetical protein [Flavobacterium]|uniref:hypothetical protein n=1 Tax=Flavobacterium TaxID=237 RepID=UPI000BDB7584|nr:MULTISPECIES: hypothetical protein [Flavobacterium]OYU79024.1 MAG: hypothetical protein CFE23_16055 [Flavobacterium sp. BFFFF1]
MRILINKSSFFFISLILLACSSKKFRDDKKLIFLNFGSPYENVKVSSLSINDSIYFSDKNLVTGIFGVDSDFSIQLKTDTVSIKGTFVNTLDPDLGENFIKEIKIDTVLYKRNGNLISIGIGFDKYGVNQRKMRRKKVKVD